ncbi:MAG: DUF2238 domain-containing protein, partial [Thermomicrobiales bacterium]|nr:DUF2238 domain-containing protein [Thermomicrobiales bacterium]
ATAANGGLSGVACRVVVAAVYADTLGNAAGFYRNYAAYDKIVHALGTAALAAACYELLTALHRWSTDGLCAVAAVGAAMFFAAGWELYEFSADLIFATYRHAGTLDTTYDLIFDTIGAVAMAGFLARRESLAALRAVPALPDRPVEYARPHAATASLRCSTLVER